MDSPPMFFRLHTDGVAQPVDLTGLYAGPTRTACWIIGGGPSLATLPTSDIAASPLPKFAVNLSGHKLLRPNFWTSYDPTARFHRSIYLDSSILKFVHRCRATDLIPETTFKVCDAPATLFFDRDPQRGYHNVLGQSPRVTAMPPVASSSENRDAGQPVPVGPGVIDWQDSLIQAIDIAWQLGFRTLLLAGCDMFVPPSPEQLALAQSVGVDYRPREPLRDFFDRCRQAGLPPDRFEPLPAAPQYHFDESKPLAAAVQTDLHYFRVSQYLRLSRRALALAGLEIISATPGSRLNDYFPFQTAADLIKAHLSQIGDPRLESTRGRYTQPSPPRPGNLGPMRDFPPHNWPRRGHPGPRPERAPSRSESESESITARRKRLRQAIAELPEVEVALGEPG